MTCAPNRGDSPSKTTGGEPTGGAFVWSRPVADSEPAFSFAVNDNPGAHMDIACFSQATDAGGIVPCQLTVPDDAEIIGIGYLDGRQEEGATTFHANYPAGDERRAFIGYIKVAREGDHAIEGNVVGMHEAGNDT